MIRALRRVTCIGTQGDLETDALKFNLDLEAGRAGDDLEEWPWEALSVFRADTV